MSAVIELSAVRSRHAFNRALAEALGKHYSRVASLVMAKAVRRLVDRGMSENEACRRVILPKDAPVFGGVA